VEIPVGQVLEDCGEVLAADAHVEILVSSPRRAEREFESVPPATNQRKGAVRNTSRMASTVSGEQGSPRCMCSPTAEVFRV
jgi:hypothetical protein